MNDLAVIPGRPNAVEPRPGGGLGVIAVRRLALGVLVLFLVSIAVFAATQVLPGDAARSVLGRNATPENLAALRRQLHLDRPVVAQYFSWFGGLLRGDAGDSLAARQPVLSLVGPRLANSSWLLLFTALLAFPVSLSAGVLAAVRRDRLADHTMTTVALAAAAMPEFTVAIALILLLASGLLHILPPVSLVPPGASVWDQPDVLVLPVLTLTITVIPYVFRMIRASMIEAFESDYVEMARLNGLGERRVILGHALPNALPPAIQSIGLTLAYLAGGVVVVEYVFGYPGIGQALVNAVNNRDIPTIQFTVLVLAAFYVGVNILSDLASLALSPKARR